MVARMSVITNTVSVFAFVEEVYNLIGDNSPFSKQSTSLTNIIITKVTQITHVEIDVGVENVK